MGVDCDPNQSWDWKKARRRISGRVVHPSDITGSAIGDRAGRWTTVVGTGVFLEFAGAPVLKTRTTLALEDVNQAFGMDPA